MILVNGGVGIGKNLFVGGNTNITGDLTVDGDVNFASIVGTSGTFGNIKVAVTDDNTTVGINKICILPAKNLAVFPSE